MKASQEAKKLVPKEYAINIFQQCQNIVNGASHLFVSKELNFSDKDIILEVFDNLLTISDEKVERAVKNRVCGLFKQWLLNKETYER